MDFSSNISKKIIKKIKNIFWFLGLHAFSLILFLIFIDFIIGSFIFYKYVFLAQKEDPKDNSGIILKFNDRAYDNLLQKIELKNQINEELTTDQLDENNLEVE